MSNNTQENRLAMAKQQMLDRDLKRRGISDERVLQALAVVPRERFVSAHYRSEAYADRPLPIGLDQTISQPYIVALMTYYQTIWLDYDNVTAFPIIFMSFSG